MKVKGPRTGHSCTGFDFVDGCARNKMRARTTCMQVLTKQRLSKIHSCTRCVCSLFTTPRRVRRENRILLTPYGTFRLRHLLPSVACLPLTPKPVPQLCHEIRLKKGVRRADYGAGLDKNLLIRYPQLTLRFWLYEPISKAVFKIVGPLALVLALMLVSYVGRIAEGKV